MKHLTRSKADAKVFGVCSGIAKYFEIDPVVIRVAAVVVMLCTAVVPFAFGYFVAYLIIPEEKETSFAEVVEEGKK